MTQFITNKDGRMETVKDATKITPEELARQRRELRDMLDGNVQFHEDRQAEKPPETKLYGGVRGGGMVDPSDLNGRVTAAEVRHCYETLDFLHHEQRIAATALMLRKMNKMLAGSAKKDEPGLYLDSGEFVPASQVNRGWQ